MFDNELDEWLEVETVEETDDNEHGEEASERQATSQLTKVDLEFQNELRKMILSIQNDLCISSDEKSRQIQGLMTLKWRQSEKKSIDKCASSESNGEQTKDELEPTYNEKSQELGCKHYQRGAKLQAECCKGWFTCRFCHDEGSDHKIDRHATKNMMCMHCKIVQPIGKVCNNCDRELARYYCDKCKFWDDQPEKDIYHCDGCGICRRGIGLGIDYFHCDVCDCCLQIQLKGAHKCIEKNLERDCVICGDYLFTSTMHSHLMPCGHSLHQKCYIKYVTTAYQCPTCWKSITNMDIYFRRIDAIVAQQKMPPEYEYFVARILCNDCEKRSTVKYHFLYHKCPHCQGYNTKVLETKSEPPDDNAPENEGLNSSIGSNTDNNILSNGSQVRQSRVMDVTAMLQGEEGLAENVTEHRSRNPLNSIESNH